MNEVIPTGKLGMCQYDAQHLDRNLKETGQMGDKRMRVMSKNYLLQMNRI